MAAPAVKLADVQGLVYSGFKRHPFAGFLFATLGPDRLAARAWLGGLTITSAGRDAQSRETHVQLALSASGRPLRAYSQPGAMFYRALGVHQDTINLIRDQEMGAGVAGALGPHRAALLKNHGVVVVGGTIEEAVINVIMLENAAMIQMITEAAGDPAPDFPADDIAQLKQDISRPDQFVVNFNYLVRRLERPR